MKRIALMLLGLVGLCGICRPVVAASVTSRSSIEPQETFYQPFRVTNTLGSYHIAVSINFPAKFTLFEEENNYRWIRLAKFSEAPGGLLWNSFQLSPLFGNRLYTLMVEGQTSNDGGDFNIGITGSGDFLTEIALYTPYKTSNIPIPSHESLVPGLFLIGSYLFIKDKLCGKPK